MTLSTALLLAAPLVNLIAGPAWTFQDMADSANLVVIARIDSMWYTVDTTYRTINGKNLMCLSAYTHYTAQLLSTYIKDPSYTPPTNIIHIAHVGGMLDSTRGETYSFTPYLQFRKNAVYLVALEIATFITQEEEAIFWTPVTSWKYEIKQDSLFSKRGEVLQLSEAILRLTQDFEEANYE